jgi:hypothetical protein
MTGALAGVALVGAVAAAAEPAVEPGPAQAYRFVLTSDARGETAFRALITVDGKDRLLERATTPFEFRCEAGSTIAAYIEVLDGEGAMRLKVFDPAYSKRRPSAMWKGLRRVRFAWAQPGVGPRCLDQGAGGCPDTVPSFEAMEAKLASAREDSEAPR